MAGMRCPLVGLVVTMPPRLDGSCRAVVDPVGLPRVPPSADRELVPTPTQENPSQPAAQAGAALRPNGARRRERAPRSRHKGTMRR